MIEIHSHLLPGVDDGPEDLETSLQMAQLYLNQNIHTVICTPHIDLLRFRQEQEIADEFARFQAAQVRLAEALANRQMRLRLLSGVEIRLSADLINVLKEFHQYPLTLAGTSYILIELASWQSSNLRALDHLLFNLQLAGYSPILAHPERIVSESKLLLQVLTTWVQQERVLLQVNASSLLNLSLQSSEQGDRHNHYQMIARQLVDRNLVHFVASDAHHPQSRPPQNRQAWEVLTMQYGQDVADQLTQHNPEALLADQSIRI